MVGLLTATQAPTLAPTQAPQASLAAPSFYGTRDASASLADSTGYDATKQNVSGNSLAQNQLSGILSKGSPLLTQAATAANRDSARRGLLNSSIAVGSAEDAVIKNALPIAQQDASTYGNKDVNDAAYTNRASEFTAGAKNTASLTNAQLGTQVNLSNSAESNKAAAQNAAIATDVSKFNAGSQTDMTKLGVQGAQALAQIGAQGNNSLAQIAAQGGTALAQIAAQGGVQKELANIQANTQMTLADKQIAANAALARDDNSIKMQLAGIQANTTLTAADKQNASQQLIAERNNNVNLAISGNDNATKQVLQSMDSASKLSLANIDAGTKMAIAGLDMASKEKLTRISADNQQLLQTNINAANMYAQYVTNLANISISDKMDGPAKQAAADNQLAAFDAALKAVGHISGLDLSQYFQSAPPIVPQVAATPPTDASTLPPDNGGG